VPHKSIRHLLACAAFATASLVPSAATAQDPFGPAVQTSATVTNRALTLAGKTDLHITAAQAPIANSSINLTSPDAWLFLDNIPPSISSTLLASIRINGQPAIPGANCRLAQYGPGSVIIPQGPAFPAMTVYNGQSQTGSSMPLQLYVKYNDARLGTMKMAIRSFLLKRGYMATIAQQENGAGLSMNYVAQDTDVEIDDLPNGLDASIRFVRIFPWRWVTKKGFAGDIWQNLNVGWYYNWNLNKSSTPDIEYVPIRQNMWWPNLDQDWQARGATELLGYNEPDHKDQSNLTVDAAIQGWPGLLATGLRLGSPAVSDGGLSWLYDFINKADAAHLRIDFVPVHYYRAYWDPANADAATAQFYNFLKEIHDKVKRPLWVTEFNNGANWTTAPKPTYDQEKATIAKMIAMLDKTPFVERYAIYNWVEDVRNVVRKDGSLTPAGQAYRDEVSPLSYTQSKSGPE